MEYGYIRVSTKDQNADRQYIALQNVGVHVERCFVDYESGKNFARTNYRKLIRVLKEGDVLYVKAIDRLGRNYDEIIEQWSFLVRKKGIDIVVLDCPILDTRVKTNGLTGKVITDIFLQLMSYVAQIERDNIRQRQSEGIQAAKAKGVRFGRPEKIKPDNFHSVYEEWSKKMISKR
ncbi:MAG: recombinase family protein, partial [Longicatena sp.]